MLVFTYLKLLALVRELQEFHFHYDRTTADILLNIVTER